MLLYSVVVVGFFSHTCVGHTSENFPSNTPKSFSAVFPAANFVGVIPENAPTDKAVESIQVSGVPGLFGRTNLYVANPKAFTELKSFVAGMKPYYVKGRSYQGASLSLRFMLSLTVLCRILEEGPKTEAAALDLKDDQVTQVTPSDDPNKVLNVSEALARAIADLNALSLEVANTNPSLLFRQNSFVEFARNNLMRLQEMQKQLNENNHFY